MIIAGGTYIEECLVPPSETLLGSGGRAFLALKPLLHLQFHTFFPDPEDVRLNFGSDAITHVSKAAVTFRYSHPLAKPELIGSVDARSELISIAGASVLRFGCVEGDFVINADAAVYDPQGSGDLFRKNGSQAKRLGMVLNEREAIDLTGAAEPEVAAMALLELEQAETVVIKRGAAGCIVASGTRPIARVPAFRTSRVWKIGSGDVFSATFSYYWMVRGLEPEQAALLASRQTADYVQTRIVGRLIEPPAAEPVICDPSTLSVLVVADLETMANQWVATQAKLALEALGALRVDVLEPFQSEQLLDVLGGYDALLLLPSRRYGLAGRTAEVAVARAIPNVIFCDECELSEKLSQDGFNPYDEFAGSIYNVLWSSDENTPIFRGN